ncbi:hypothetical protein ACFW04_000975 [Cataglyphis niger]
MLRNLAVKRISLKRLNSMMYYPSYNSRMYSERRRRTGTGRKRDIFEEKGAAHEEEYFRRETARQLKELREQQKKIVEEKKNKIENEKAEKEKEKKKRN